MKKVGVKKSTKWGCFLKNRISVLAVYKVMIEISANILNRWVTHETIVAIFI